jgi:hypothetical protein
MKFSAPFRQQVDPELLPLLDQMELAISRLAEYRQTTMIWNSPENRAQQFNRYIDVIWAVHLAKLLLLSETLVDTLNQQSFLLYGIIGRSLLEYTAVLRYYVRNKIQPLAQSLQGTDTVDDATLDAMTAILDKHLRGTRFNWQEILAPYQVNQRPKLPPPPTQVNVITCLEKWIEDESYIHDLYMLFCDLVHPNLGSTLMVIQQTEEKLVIGGTSTEGFGMIIFNQTFADLWTALQEIKPLLDQLQALRMAEG